MPHPEAAIEAITVTRDRSINLRYPGVIKQAMMPDGRRVYARGGNLTERAGGGPGPARFIQLSKEEQVCARVSAAASKGGGRHWTACCPAATACAC